MTFQSGGATVPGDGKAVIGMVGTGGRLLLLALSRCRS